MKIIWTAEKIFFIKQTPIRLPNGAILIPITLSENVLKLYQGKRDQDLMVDLLEEMRGDCDQGEMCLDFCCKKDFFAFSCEICPFRNLKKEGGDKNGNC